jgi:nucleoside-diphosphate-sugar epimerase
MSSSFKKYGATMKIFVTGATGFIGKHLCLRLKLLGHNVVTISRHPIMVVKKDNQKNNHVVIDLGETDRSKESYYLFENLCSHHKPDVIFHLASSAVVKPDEEDPHRIILDNTVSTQKVAHYAPKGCRVVLASSVIVYGDWLFEKGDTNRRYSEVSTCKPTSIYGMTKRASESIIESYTSSGKIDGVSARLCATIGSGLTHGIIKDFIRKIKSDNPYLEALGSHPGSTKPFCHIEDAVEALIMLGTEKGIKGEIFNVVPDDSISVEEVAEAAMSALEIDKPIKWLGEDANWKGDNRIIRTNNSLLKEAGWNLKFAKSKDVIFDIVSRSKS